MAFCITKQAVDKFKQDLKEGKIDFDKLINSSSEQRRSFFTEQFGKETASDINALFERKILLKQQKKGMIDWIKTVAKMKPEVKRDIIARVNRMDQVLQPDDNAFLEDLASQKLGVTVTQAEAENISKLGKEVAEREVKMEKGPRRPEQGRPTAGEMEYGASVVAFEKYLEALKSDKRTAVEKGIDILKNPVSIISGIAGSAKALKASLDNSFIGRQGIRLFYMGLTGDIKAGRTWMATFFKSFDMIFRTFKNQDVLDSLRAEILSDPDYNLMRKAKIGTATVEEEFPVSWPTRLPVIGRAFKASEVAFTGSAYYMRYRTAKQILNIARNTGVDLTDKNELESIGKLVNSLTARGDTGAKSAKPGFINNVIWSPKMIKANIDVLTLHAADRGFSKFARKRAAINLIRIIAGQAAVLFLASRLLDDEDAIDWDPRSANFGKIRIGNTRFDISGGMAPFITLASRVSIILKNFATDGDTPAIKNSVTGELSKVNEGGFGKRTGEDVVYDFFANKLAPAAAVVRDILRNETFEREKPSAKTTARDLGVPIPITTFKELKDDPDSVNLILGMFAESIGVGAQTYSHISTWTVSELEQEIKDNTYKRTTMRKDPETGKRIKLRKGKPHKGREGYIEILNKEIGKRLANN